MKKVVCLILMSMTLVLTACGANGKQSAAYGSFTLEEYYKTFEQMTNASSIVAVVKVKNTPKDIEYLHANFTINHAVVQDVIVGDVEEDEIKLLEFSSIAVGNNQRYLLFLKPYEGPITKNAYVVTGVYQGKFKITKDHQVDYLPGQSGGFSSFQKDLTQHSLDEIKDKIKKISNQGIK